MPSIPSIAISRSQPTVEDDDVLITIQTKSGIFPVTCKEGDNVLYAGLRVGLTLPYECATGTCGTCRCRVTEGETDLQWENAPGLAYVKQDKNETLMCQARVRSNSTIRVPAEVTDTGSRPGYFSGTLSNLVSLTHDVARFTIDLDRPVSFDAGQFVVLNEPSLEGGRAYSMTNHTGETSKIDFVVKRKPKGKFSDWLFDTSPNGVSLSVFGPLGRATFDPSEGKNILCMAGGSGIAGMMAIMEHGTACGYFADHRADVFFGVRTSTDIFFGDTLNRYVDCFPETVSVTIALSDEEPDDALRARYPSLKFANGFVHSVTSEHMKDRYENVVGYIAGPPPMVDGALRILVLEARLPASDIRYDKFG